MYYYDKNKILIFIYQPEESSFSVVAKRGFFILNKIIMVYKTALKIMAVVIYFYTCIWTFNHIYAWVGILMSILGVLFLVNYFNKQIKS